MSNPLEKVTSHFKHKISGEMRSVHVPEWDMEIYYKSSNTLKEQQSIIQQAQKGNTVEALVESLIMKARDKDGKKIFKPADKTVFMNEADPEVVIRVVGEMNNVDLEQVGEVEKN